MQDEPKDVIDARAAALADAIEDLKYDLVALREDHGLTQPEVAARLGISQSAVSQFERYDSNPTLRTLRQYALAVGARLSIEVADDLAPADVAVAQAGGFEVEAYPKPVVANWTASRTEMTCA